MANVIPERALYSGGPTREWIREVHRTSFWDSNNELKGGYGAIWKLGEDGKWRKRELRVNPPKPPVTDYISVTIP